VAKKTQDVYIARQRYYQVQTAETKTNLGVGGNPLAAALGIGQQQTTQPKVNPPVTEPASFGTDVKTPPRSKEPDILELLGMT
jgi:hypothetical protein